MIFNATFVAPAQWQLSFSGTNCPFYLLWGSSPTGRRRSRSNHGPVALCIAS